MVRLEAVLDSWKTIRQDTAQALLDMPSGALEFRPLPELMTFRELAVHILNAGHGLASMLSAGEENFAAPGVRERMRGFFLDTSAMEAAHLAAALQSTVESDCATLAALPAGFWAHIITRLDGRQVTRLEMLQFTKEHELTHRSQMFLYLRLNGIVPQTTRRRMAAK